MNRESLDRAAMTKIPVEDARPPRVDDSVRGIDAQDPDRMPRAEDDERTREGSPEFHDRPGSGKHITPEEVQPGVKPVR